MIRLYVDEHVPSKVTEGRRRYRVDTVTAQDVGHVQVEDERHFAFATEHHRVLVTQDKDFTRLHNAGVVHSGIVFCPQGTKVRGFIRGLRLVCECMTAEEIAGTVYYL